MVSLIKFEFLLPITEVVKGEREEKVEIYHLVDIALIFALHWEWCQPVIGDVKCDNKFFGLGKHFCKNLGKLSCCGDQYRNLLQEIIFRDINSTQKLGLTISF